VQVWACKVIGKSAERLFFLCGRLKTFRLLNQRVNDHACHRFSAFEHCNVRQKFIFSQTFRSHLKILDAGRMIQGKFHFEEPQISGATVRSPGICAPLNIQPCFRFEVEGYRNVNKPRSLCCLILHSGTENCGTECVI